MLTPQDRRAHYAFIQDVFRRRSRNMRRIVEALGGYQETAKACGKPVAKLHQICDADHPWHQTIGEKLAREIEYALRLVPGTLDSPYFDPPFRPKNPLPHGPESL